MQAKPIETSYKGYLFRSRLEARWAVYFDALGIAWEYEKEGYKTSAGNYLPDFWLPSIGAFAEVKPQNFSRAEIQKCCALPRPCIMLNVGTPTAQEYHLAGDFEQWGVILSQSQYKGRLWFDAGEGFAQYQETEMRGELAARSARFEFGENGATLC